MPVSVERRGPVTVVTIDRPEVRNAVDRDTAVGLRDAFSSFDDDAEAEVAILTGAGGTFCAGFDLKAVAAGAGAGVPDDIDSHDGPMGPTRMLLSKPVIAAVEGYAVGGGLELAAWCDLRIAGEGSTFGVFNRRFGVPLIDGGTVRLPRIVGHGRALEMIITGRAVPASEALSWGLVNQVVPDGTALDAAIELGTTIAAFPQTTLRSDRWSTYEQWSLSLEDALTNELAHGARSLAGGEGVAGATRFVDGSGRHGSSDD